MTETLDVAPSGDVAAALNAAEDHVEIMAWADPDGTGNDRVNVIAHREDYHLEVVDLERYGKAPSRPKGTVTAATADGFTAAVQHRSAEADATVIYADLDGITLTAVLNDDHHDQPGWRDHRINWRPQVTPEWTHWTRNIGLGTQERFAETIENGESDIIEPSSTVMLEIAQTFQASTEAKFKRGGRLRDGRTQLVYEEEVEATAGEGGVTIPETFTVQLRPFYGAESVPVVCKLRYRLNRGDLQIGYTIVRPEEILRTSFNAAVWDIKDTLDSLLFVEGQPAGARTDGR